MKCLPFLWWLTLRSWATTQNERITRGDSYFFKYSAMILGEMGIYISTLHDLERYLASGTKKEYHRTNSFHRHVSISKVAERLCRCKKVCRDKFGKKLASKTDLSLVNHVIY